MRDIPRGGNLRGDEENRAIQIVGRVKRPLVVHAKELRGMASEELIEKNGQSLCGKDGDLELVSAEDYFTGSRYVRRLRRIEVLLAT